MNSLGKADPQGEVSSKVSEFWSEDAATRAEQEGWYWMSHPMVLARVNQKISGDPHSDAYARLHGLYAERAWALPIKSAISLGCGFGNLERDLLSRGWVANIDAYDLAEGAIAEARRLALLAGFQSVSYHQADLNTLKLPAGSADAVFAHSSIHHVEQLEAIYETVWSALKPGGVFHLNEFIGPTRFQWTDAQLGLVNEFLETLPPRSRALPSGSPKPAMVRPTIAQMLEADPSESIRSAELVGLLEPLFEIIEYRETGGAILHLALGGIAQNFDPDSAQDAEILNRLFAIEDSAMSQGLVGSDFAVITAVPRS